MAALKELTRKSDVLRRPSLPCLSRYYTINLLDGCPYNCLYCYARSFRSNHDDTTIGFYVNTLEKLKHELPGKHKKPVCVYFSTACEPFIPDKKVSDMLFELMKYLLENGISLLVSTKSKIPERFTALFENYSGHVHIQFGLTTTDDELRKIIEPDAFPVNDRLSSLHTLIKNGIPSEIRMDPLIPGLTDTEKSFKMLCSRIAEFGATEAAASYLFIRHGNYKSMMFNYNGWSFSEMEKRLYSGKIKKYCGNGAIRVPDASYRIESFRFLKNWACEYGIKLRLCGCKNPDVTDECCHPVISEHKPEKTQLELFTNGE
jgi:DNA repair photolyase